LIAVTHYWSCLVTVTNTAEAERDSHVNDQVLDPTLQSEL